MINVVDDQDHSSCFLAANSLPYPQQTFYAKNRLVDQAQPCLGSSSVRVLRCGLVSHPPIDRTKCARVQRIRIQCSEVVLGRDDVSG
jgi:hypothetical protein